MNEDKSKGKNHSYSTFSQLQELYGYSIQDGKGDLNGEKIIRKTKGGIKWKELNHTT